MAGLVGVKVVASRLGVSTWRIYHLVMQGSLPAVRLAQKQLKFDERAIEAYIEKRGNAETISMVHR